MTLPYTRRFEIAIKSGEFTTRPLGLLWLSRFFYGLQLRANLTRSDIEQFSEKHKIYIDTHLSMVYPTHRRKSM